MTEVLSFTYRIDNTALHRTAAVMPEWVPEENTLNYTSIYDGGLQEGWHFTSKSSNVSISEVPQAGRDNSTAVCFTMPTSEVRVLVWSVLDAC